MTEYTLNQKIYRGLTYISFFRLLLIHTQEQLFEDNLKIKCSGNSEKFAEKHQGQRLLFLHLVIACLHICRK